jgi:hypothetical protein
MTVTFIVTGVALLVLGCIAYVSIKEHRKK